MAFPHEAILVFNFFTALVDAFPYHSWPSATRDMGKCINACCEKVEHSNCLMWKSYISRTGNEKNLHIFASSGPILIIFTFLKMASKFVGTFSYVLRV